MSDETQESWKPFPQMVQDDWDREAAAFLEQRRRESEARERRRIEREQREKNLSRKEAFFEWHRNNPPNAGSKAWMAEELVKQRQRESND